MRVGMEALLDLRLQHTTIVMTIIIVIIIIITITITIIITLDNRRISRSMIIPLMTHLTWASWLQLERMRVGMEALLDMHNPEELRRLCGALGLQVGLAASS
jgi:prepilin signal peptidase PulO-like enzyme (type II secretory pathway)